MTEKIYYEDHNLLMKDSPIIYHHDTVHNENKLRYINLHENIEILYVTGGSGTVLNGNNLYEVKEGNIIIINSNHPHTVNSARSVYYDCLIINKNYLLENGIDTVREFFSAFIEKDAKIAEYFLKLNELSVSTSQQCALKSKAYSLLIMAHISENYSAKSENNSQPENEISSAFSFIMQNLTRKISLDEIAAQTGYDKYYFVRKFKELTEKTPVEFINDQRCNYAKILLSNTENTVSDIASAVGIENPAYFAKVFAKVTGVTPSKFRQISRRR